MREFLWALRFLTIIPLGRDTEDLPPQRAGVAMSLFPVVGLVIGLFLVVVYLPLAMLFPAKLADALIIMVFIIVTGALHLDGLADSLDGLLGGWDPRRRLEIMKDSRIGTFGVLGLFMVIGLKYLAFNDIGGHAPAAFPSLEAYLPPYGSFQEKATILLLMPVMGRWSQVLAAGLYPYAREEPGTASALVTNTHLRHAIFASATAIFLAGLLIGDINFAIILTGVLAVSVILQASYISSRIGGLTGDTLGAINEVTELLFLLSFYVII
ncbi:MAG: adenosylcobinamide-GDP ribazoletransferase [Candidatus Brocadiales bacterium]